MKLFWKEANAFVYTIILVNLALIIALVVYNNTFIIRDAIDFSDTNLELTTNLTKKADINLSAVKLYNTNWWWFSDTFACPDIITFLKKNASWQLIWDWMTTSTLTYQAWDIFCSFDYDWQAWKIYYEGIDFTFINYNNSDNTLTNSWANLITQEEINWSYIFFRKPSTWDNIDDDFDSDNFRSTSLEDYEYPNWYVDDDIFPRLTLINEIPATSDYYNIFWINNNIIDEINNNSFNNDSPDVLIKAWEVEAWNLKLDISSQQELNYEIKIIEFDREKFDSTWELIEKNIYNSDILSINSWYIKIEDWKIKLNKIKNSSEYNFNFKTSDYAIFIKNNSEADLVVHLNWIEVWSYKQIFLNAINDSYEDKLEILVNHIIIKENNYINKHYTKTESKDYFSNFYNCKKYWDIVEARSRYPWCNNNDIVVCDWPNSWIIVASCNVWAKYAGEHIECNIWNMLQSNKEKCNSEYIWAYFQWWNNFAFKPEKTPITTNTKVSTTWYWNWIFYENDKFITVADENSSWSSGDVKPLWWADWENQQNKRWPCANWYHIPTWWDSWEWWRIINILWVWNDSAKLREKLLLPALGYRYFSNWTLSSVWVEWTYWSSSESSGKYSYLQFLSSYSYINSTSSKLTPAMALPVRCVKNY